ncbi:MucR family transcriptional regulator [Roseomonas gilardii subsp. gilardii]|nr:MucR family transcriptional regulator [Roseomonas gilardii]UPG73480.1 MucR family transcriptional regulator [Roseomonas gilardii subsp. gilardii]
MEVSGDFLGEAPAAAPVAEHPASTEPVAGPMGPRPEPAVPIAESVTPEYLVCLEDGRQVKMLTRHLKAAYGMTPDQYRARWGLPPDYPMMAPGSAERRAAARAPRAAGRGRAGGEEGAVE